MRTLNKSFEPSKKNGKKLLDGQLASYWPFYRTNIFVKIPLSSILFVEAKILENFKFRVIHKYYKLHITYELIELN